MLGFGFVFVWIFALHLYMTKIGKDFVFSLNFLFFLRNGQNRVPYEVGGFCGTGRAAFLTRLVVFAERAEPRSLQGEVR